MSPSRLGPWDLVVRTLGFLVKLHCFVLGSEGQNRVVAGSRSEGVSKLRLQCEYRLETIMSTLLMRLSKYTVC